MKKLEFVTEIHASPEKVWGTLWQDASYRKWTSVFMEGSYAESDWKEGSRIKFLSPGGKGMYSVIRRKVENEEMIFEHLGEVRDGKEIPQQWGGAQERYFLKKTGENTQLKVVLDASEEWEKYFSETFPKALALVRQLSES